LQPEAAGVAAEVAAKAAGVAEEEAAMMEVAMVAEEAGADANPIAM
jgi:hypothetical protein